MDIALWIGQILLALFFGLIGGSKLFGKKEQLDGMGLIAGPARLLGLAEILGALGMILPGILGTATFLTPVAAVCFTVVMAGALLFHRKHPSERGNGMLWAVLVISLAVAVLRVVFPL